MTYTFQHQNHVHFQSNATIGRKKIFLFLRDVAHETRAANGDTSAHLSKTDVSSPTILILRPSSPLPHPSPSPSFLLPPPSLSPASPPPRGKVFLTEIKAHVNQQACQRVTLIQGYFHTIVHTSSNLSTKTCTFPWVCVRVCSLLHHKNNQQIHSLVFYLVSLPFLVEGGMLFLTIGLDLKTPRTQTSGVFRRVSGEI